MKFTVPTIIALLGLGCAVPAGPLAASDPSVSGKVDGASPDRADWVRQEITAVNDWISAEDRATKYDKMSGSAFSFFRGTNHLFWADFANDPRLDGYGGTTETSTWIQGDLHAYNFGSFDDDDGEVVYDLNDFDEGVIADYQFDVWRMATSLVLAADANGLEDDEAIVDAFTESYLDTVADYRGNDDETDTAFTRETTDGQLADFLVDVEEDESRVEMLDKWTNDDGEGRLFDFSSSKLEAVSDGFAYELERAMVEYGATLSGGLDYDYDYFRVKSIAKRLRAGTGSLGTPRYYVLIEGPTDDQDDDVILDVKRQGEPSALQYLPVDAQVRYDETFDNHAERSTIAQRALTDDVDDHLGWLELEDGSYSVRARSPFKDDIDTDDLETVELFVEVAEQWGAILATAHARADKDFRDELVPHSFDREVDERTDGDHAGFRALVREVAIAYAAQVQRDFDAFLVLAAAEPIEAEDR